MFYTRALPGEEDKVLCVANLLSGSAFDWFEPRMRDFLEHGTDDERDSETKRLFSKYSNFTAELKAVFGEVDEQKTAERKLLQLRQVGLVSNYKSEFRKITAKLD